MLSGALPVLREDRISAQNFQISEEFTTINYAYAIGKQNQTVLTICEKHLPALALRNAPQGTQCVGEQRVTDRPVQLFRKKALHPNSVRPVHLFRNARQRIGDGVERAKKIVAAPFSIRHRHPLASPTSMTAHLEQRRMKLPCTQGAHRNVSVTELEDVRAGFTATTAVGTAVNIQGEQTGGCRRFTDSA